MAQATIDTLIEKFREDKDPMAHGAVCELLYWKHRGYTLKDIEQRYYDLHPKHRMLETTGNAELLNIIRGRRRCRRSALRELGKLHKEC